MGALAKLFSSSDKILALFFFKVLPELLRLIVLSICILWKHFKHLNSNYKYTSIINKKSSKFTYRKSCKPAELVDIVDQCSICLSEFTEGDYCRELVDCRHGFHGVCLEKWLKVSHTATCPLCRSLVVPEVIVAEYQLMKFEQEKDGIFEKELALILLNALHGGSCVAGFFLGQDFT